MNYAPRRSQLEQILSQMGCGTCLIVMFVALGMVGIVLHEGGTFLMDRGYLPTPPPTVTPFPTATPPPTATWEEWKAAAEEIPYKELVRYVEDHQFKSHIYFRARIFDVDEKGSGEFEIKAYVGGEDRGFYEDPVFLSYSSAPVRVLDDDIIEFVGYVVGLRTIYGNRYLWISVISLIIESE